MKALLPFLRLFRHQWKMMLLGLALSVVTLGAGIGLLSLSGWFLSAAAVAGLLPATAYTFNSAIKPPLPVVDPVRFYRSREK